MKKTLILRTLLFLLPVLVVTALPPAPVRADAAPPPVPGIGGLQTFEYQKTEVQMRYERVEMELQQYPDPDAPENIDQVMVNAWFILHNTGSQTEQMQVVFPLGDFTACLADHAYSVSYSTFESDPGSFSAWVDGDPAAVSRITTAHPYLDKDFCQDKQMDWAAFDVTFPTDRDVVVRVSYLLLPSGGSFVQNVAYILETGAGWKGPIGGGVIVFRFPYQVEENVIEGTTPDYQTLENEIYWTFGNLEPTLKDNLRVNFVSPFGRKTIQTNLERVRQNPQDISTWIQLAESYYDMTFIKSGAIDDRYEKKVWQTYEQALKANPTSPEIAASYASHLYWSCCMYQPPSEANFKKIMGLVDLTLRYDPINEPVKYILADFRANLPDFTYSPPEAISTLTPTPTATPLPTETLPPTAVPSATATILPTLAPSPTNTASPSPAPSATAVEAFATAKPFATITAAPTIVQAAATARPILWLWPAAGLLAGIVIMLGLWSLRGKTWN